ncbi:histidine triad nucleotide-binding protein [Paenibacillus hexagrammi]|uniref:Histidine triad nucleotide-binding protein n=1 Tax=Paenibacillus hexagrammi TaxID=2908839 RepID=A0ABY3SMF4_9BACL|nr:histidine triad nucleotide-binding protein [Paenibacillus sp. YPD9-1]UJF35073.1 histidine triad nucleotide-binding protein [Paenibacillus sp. YPD9-1]
MSDCIFCKIVEGSLPSTKVYEDDRVVAFHDIQPAAPIHILIIPKKHFASLNEAGESDWEVIGQIHKAAQEIAKKLDVADSGYRVVTNCGSNAGQVVHHLHYHLLAGAKLAPLGVDN